MPPDRTVYVAELLVAILLFVGIAVVTSGWAPKAATYAALFAGVDWR